MRNESTQNTDHRRVEHVMVEKAIVGAVPAFFKVLGDSRLHPVRFYEHPHLCEIHFTDGSVSQVKATKQKEEFEKRVGAVPEPRSEGDVEYDERSMTQRDLETGDFDELIRQQMSAATDELESTVEVTDPPAPSQFMTADEVPALNPFSGNQLKRSDKSL